MDDPKPRYTGDEVVAAVLDRSPHLQDTFVEFGFKNILNPVMRATLAKKVTLKMACGMKGVDLASFLNTLNERA
jgi:hypothetical protein